MFNKYTAHATASGAGRNGEVESGDLKLKLALPKELGGTGAGHNPEQLFAAGYSGVFFRCHFNFPFSYLLSVFPQCFAGCSS